VGIDQAEIARRMGGWDGAAEWCLHSEPETLHTTPYTLHPTP